MTKRCAVINPRVLFRFVGIRKPKLRAEADAPSVRVTSRPSVIQGRARDTLKVERLEG